MSRERPTPYSELAEVIEILGHLVRENRRRKGLSLRAAAEEIGIDFNSLTRVEKGHAFMTTKLPHIIRWLGRP